MGAVVEAAVGEVRAQVQAPGSAALAVGAGDEGTESLAVWQVSPEGAPTGAWVVPTAEALATPDAARWLVTVLERRAIVAGPDTDVVTWLDRLSTSAGLKDAWWAKQLFSATEAFRETADRRRVYEASVTASRQSNKSITALEWAHDLPDDTDVADFAAVRHVARIGEAAGTPVVSEVLTTTRVLRWLVAVWAETEQVKSRRTYVRAEHGEPEALPPSWLAAVQTAGNTRLPL